MPGTKKRANHSGLALFFVKPGAGIAPAGPPWRGKMADYSPDLIPAHPGVFLPGHPFCVRWFTQEVHRLSGCQHAVQGLPPQLPGFPRAAKPSITLAVGHSYYATPPRMNPPCPANFEKTVGLFTGLEPARGTSLLLHDIGHQRRIRGHVPVS